MRCSYDFDAVDLFAGIGWGCAARRLGLTEIGLDNDRNVLKLRSAHDHATLLVDLWNFQPAEFSLRFGGLLGSPSCVKFSLAGKGEGRALLDQILAAVPQIAAGKAVRDVLPDMDPEAALVLAPLQWIVYHRPVWVALEQVKEVQPVWDAYAVALAELGYSVDTGILHAEQYGVPQTRTRSILVANRTRAVTLPKPTHSRYYPRNPSKSDPGLLKWVSMAQGLGWSVDENSVMRSNYGTGGDASLRGLRDGTQPAPTVTSKINRNKWIRPEEGDWSGVEMGDVRSSRGTIRNAEEPASTVTGSMDNGNYQFREVGDNEGKYAAGGYTKKSQNPGTVKWEKRPDSPAPADRTDGEIPEWTAERPSTTLVGSFRPDIIAAPGWRKPGDGPRRNTKDSVRVSIDEAARLQTFSEDLDWSVLAKTAAYRVVGNAIPGLLAEVTITAAMGI